MAAIKTQEIDDFSISSDTFKITATPVYSSSYYGAVPPSTMADLTLGNITISNGGTYSIGSGGANANAVWTTTGTTTGWNQSAIGSIQPSATISLKGKDADIDINGKSLVDWMEAMEERMNWMQPNVELEKEWDDLRKLGDRYRKLEKKCKEKAEVWNKLKKL